MSLRQAFGAAYLKTQKLRLLQRFTIVFLLAGFMASIVLPSVTAYALEQQGQQTPEQTNTHTKKLDEQELNKPMGQNYPSALPEKQATTAPSADYEQPAASGIPGLPGTATAKHVATAPGLQTATTPSPSIERTEMVEKRTANSETFRNTDGSYTTKRYSSPRFYKKDGGWQKIDTSLY